MKWTPLDDENGYRCLSIEAPWEEIAPDYDDLVNRYVATVRLPGFRSGKTPRGAVEQRCRREILADLGTRIVQRFGREAVLGEGDEALGPLEASDLHCDKGQAFSARVRYFPLPAFTLPELSGLATADDADPRDRISHRLLELTPFAVPDELIRGELALDGLEEELPAGAAWQGATDRIRLMTILKKIARQEGIEVDQRDLTQRIREKAEEFGTTPKALQAELEEGGGISRLKDLLLAERTLDYLLEIIEQ